MWCSGSLTSQNLQALNVKRNTVICKKLQYINKNKLMQFKINEKLFKKI